MLKYLAQCQTQSRHFINVSLLPSFFLLCLSLFLSSFLLIPCFTALLKITCTVLALPGDPEASWGPSPGSAISVSSLQCPQMAIQAVLPRKTLAFLHPTPSCLLKGCVQHSAEREGSDREALTHTEYLLKARG